MVKLFQPCYLYKFWYFSMKHFTINILIGNNTSLPLYGFICRETIIFIYTYPYYKVNYKIQNYYQPQNIFFFILYFTKPFHNPPYLVKSFFLIFQGFFSYISQMNEPRQWTFLCIWYENRGVGYTK